MHLLAMTVAATAFALAPFRRTSATIIMERPPTGSPAIQTSVGA